MTRSSSKGGSQSGQDERDRQDERKANSPAGNQAIILKTEEGCWVPADQSGSSFKPDIKDDPVNPLYPVILSEG